MIASPQNPKLKLVRALLSQAKTRAHEQKMVLEGVRLVRDVFEQGYAPDFVLHKTTFENQLLVDLGAAEIECLPVEPKLFDQLSETEHTQGIIGVFPIPQLPIPQNATLLLALDQLRDPGNVGTILRTAAAAGVEGIITLPGTVDAYNPKVVRAGMGAHFRLPIVEMDWQIFGDQFGSGWQIWQADANTPGAVPYHQADWTPATLLIIGSEATGISEMARHYAKNAVFIPMAAGVESLNASIAAAVILFEIQRQQGNLS